MYARRAIAAFVLAPAILAAFPATTEAGRFSHCECVDDYQPAKGVLKLWTWPIKTEWEERHHCIPGGPKSPVRTTNAYKVKVITYRERYTDGTQRTWKCVVAGSEVPLGK